MRLKLLVVIALAVQARAAVATDACSTRSITTKADVEVSDGSEFLTESYYNSRNSAAIRHLDDGDRLIAVEGPVGWARDGERAQMGPEFYKLFALGHQYHAFLLEFDQIAGNVRESDGIAFGGQSYSATSGEYPYGGTVHLVHGEDASRPVGLRFDYPEERLITAAFLDWRQQDGIELPFHIRIDDGDRTFDYRYTDVSISASSPLWFFEAVPAPELDELQVYRLHRKLLTAHCLGDADMMASLSAPVVLSANRGSLNETANEDLKTRFTSLFDALDYTGYHDLLEPTIELSGDVGWIGVNTRAVGNQIGTGKPFDDQWAWIMTVRKVDGRWLHSANASNRLE